MACFDEGGDLIAPAVPKLSSLAVSPKGVYIGEAMDKDDWRFRGCFGWTLVNIMILQAVDYRISVVKGIRLQWVHWFSGGHPDIRSHNPCIGQLT